MTEPLALTPGRLWALVLGLPFVLGAIGYTGLHYVALVGQDSYRLQPIVAPIAKEVQRRSWQWRHHGLAEQRQAGRHERPRQLQPHPARGELGSHRHRGVPERPELLLGRRLRRRAHP